MKRFALAPLAALALAGAAMADDTLADIVQSGNHDAAMAAIADGADVDAAQPDGSTALLWAVFNVDKELVRALLRRGADADLVTAYCASPLGEAVKLGDAELVSMLLDAGASPDARNADDQTALMLAARTGVPQVARLLIDAGADVNAIENWRGQTALMWAAATEHPEIVQMLVDAGADVTVRAKMNDWARQITAEPRAQYRQTGGLTALLYAARDGCFECAVSIVEAGADVNLPSPDGITPLIMAIDNFSYDTAKYLLEHGANPHTWDWWGRTPLYSAVDMHSYRPGRGGFDPQGPGLGREQPTDSEVQPMEIIRMLLDMGVDPNSQLNLWRPVGNTGGRFVDDSLTVGTTPLYLAAISYDNEVVELLLDAGADPNLPNVMGITPLMGASGMGISLRDSRGNFFDGKAQERAIPTLQLLVDAGAEVNKRVEGTTTRTGRIARISTMTDKEGQTAMYSCAQWGWDQVCKFLLDHGGDVKVTDALGKTPVDAARNRAGGRERTEHPEIVAMYEAAGGVASVEDQEQAALETDTAQN